MIQKTNRIVLDEQTYYPVFITDEGIPRLDKGVPVSPENLEILAETEIKEEFSFNGRNKLKLMLKAMEVINQQSLNYAKLKGITGVYTTDDYREHTPLKINSVKSSSFNSSKFVVDAKIIYFGIANMDSTARQLKEYIL